MVAGLILVAVAGMLFFGGILWVGCDHKKPSGLLFTGVSPVEVAVDTERVPNVQGPGPQSTNYFKDYVEAYLQKAGIPVALTKAENESDVPMLQIEIHFARHDPWTAYYVTLDWREKVVVERAGYKDWARLWGSSVLGLTDAGDVGEAVKKSLEAHLDGFVSDYLKCNPSAVTARR